MSQEPLGLVGAAPAVALSPGRYLALRSQGRLHAYVEAGADCSGVG